MDDGRAQCDLCPHGCRIPEGGAGRCRVRRVEGGELKADSYGRLSSVNIDPIEKKPLHHFVPGSSILSIGGWGCNFTCRFCQNWSISQQVQAEGPRTSPDEIVSRADAGGSIGIAYTYNEPLVGYEFVQDCARLAHAAGLANVLVTNGFIRPEPASELLPLIAALNIDVKSMDEDFYRSYCGGSLAPVLAFARQAVSLGCHVEVTNLIIPGLNDGERGLRELAEWIAVKLGPGVPLHLSAYYPRYKLELPPTPEHVLERAHAVCAEALDYVYLGNVMTGLGQDTLCPGCGTVLIRRRGYRTRVENVRERACQACGRPLDFVPTYSSAGSSSGSGSTGAAGVSAGS